MLLRSAVSTLILPRRLGLGSVLIFNRFGWVDVIKRVFIVEVVFAVRAIRFVVQLSS